MLRSDLRGLALGEFVLGERIADDGISAVYRGVQAAIERPVMIKVMRQKLRRDGALQHFTKETVHALRLAHPYVASVYAFGIEHDEGLLWVAAEEAEGLALHRWLREHGPMPLDRFVPFFERVAEVVQTAHDLHIVHRDLKPSNVMVIERAGQLLPKLLDFGLARLFDQAASAPMVSTTALPDALHGVPPVDPAPLDIVGSDAIIGSPPYMSPEQWNDPAAVGPPADLYALAVIAYEALTGRRPFIATTVTEYAMQHLDAPVPPLGDRFSWALDRWFERALAKRPEHRWPNAHDLAAALRVASGIDHSARQIRGAPEQLSGELEPALRFAVASDPSVRITVYSAGGSKLGSGDGALALSLHRGLYRVHFTRCGVVRELLVEHDGETLLQDPGPPLDTPVPMAGGLASHDYYREAAQRLSTSDTHPPLGDSPHSARLFLFIRRRSRDVGPVRIPSEPVTICDHTGRKLVALEPRTARSDDVLGYLAFSSAVAPGTYRIRALHHRREVAITIPENRAAHVWLADSGTVRMDDLRASLIDLRAGFDPENPVAHAMESVLAALRSPEIAFPVDARTLLPDAVEHDLVFGIAAAHQLWRCRDTAAFDQVMTRLAKYATVPDIAILLALWRSDAGATQSAFVAPPLLRASVDLAMTRPEFDTAAVSPDGGFARAAATELHDSTWFTWSARAWEERWIEPTVEGLRSHGRADDMLSIARTTRLPVPTVQRVIERLDRRSFFTLLGSAKDIACQIPGYQVGDMARPGTHAVFEATRVSDGVAIALEIAMLRGGDSTAQIDRELQRFQDLRHPGLLVLDRWGTVARDTAVWFDSELCRDTVLDVLSSSNAPLSVDRACKLICDALDVIGYLHRNGIVHGRIGPSEIFVRSDGTAALAAMSLVRGDAPADTAGTGVIGGAGFRAPEQLDDAGAITEAADVWSAAATLYFLLSLDLPREPYAGQDDWRAARDNPVIPIGERRADVPSELARCLDQALSADVLARPRNGDAFRKDLLAALAEHDAMTSRRIRRNGDPRRDDRSRGAPASAKERVAAYVRTSPRRVLAGLGLAAAAVTGIYVTWRGVAPDPEAQLVEQCEDAMNRKLRVAPEVCLASYQQTGDPATGARAAQALQDRAGSLPVLEQIASTVGDNPAGADAWLAVAVQRGRHGDALSELAAYQRAVASRAVSDVPGQLRNAVALLEYHRRQGDYQAAVTQAALAHDLTDHVARREDLALAYVAIVRLLIELGEANRPAVEALLEKARSVISPFSRYYGALRRLDASRERALHHPNVEGLALREAWAFAIRDGDQEAEFHARMDLIDRALRDGALDEATALLAFDRPGPDAFPEERVADAFYRAWLAMARGRPFDATPLVESVLSGSRGAWTPRLEDLQGRALLQAGERTAGEQALLRAADAVERIRAGLDSDALRSSLLASLREPFEALFELYIADGRLTDALAVVQRASAREVLDELIERAQSLDAPANSAHDASDGARTSTARRSPPASKAPPIENVLARLRGNHVITYFRARAELWAVAIAVDGSLRARDLGAVDELARQADAWRGQTEDAGSADALGRRVLPDELMPPSGTPLYVVPDESIAGLSFAALRRNGVLVIDRHAIAYAPSAAVLAMMPRSRPIVRAVVVGDPVGDLPFARAEVKAVAALLHVEPRLGADATRAAVLGDRDATLVHIAAHSASMPDGTALRLSDGVLDARAVLEHGVSAGAIFVLNACFTEGVRFPEITSLPTALVAVGAHAVVASHWAVPDDVGREFSQLFYAANGVIDPVAAVAAAQRELFKQRVPVEQWSTFVVVAGLP